jgi:RNA polymerase sigma-70 factor (ECF subfamily)
MKKPEKKQAFLKEFLSIREDLFAFVYSMVPSYSKAEDIFQDASLVLWERFETFTQGTNFKAWARQVMYNKIRNEWQKKNREEVWDPEVFEALDRAFEETHSTQHEWKEALDHCLKKLSHTAREIVRFKYFELKTFQEIGEILDRSAKGTRVILHRIRNTLAECIQKQIEGIAE